VRNGDLLVKSRQEKFEGKYLTSRRNGKNVKAKKEMEC
jgi:hypothetical protein